MSQTLLISVGGTASPVIFSILHHKPKRVVFFVSHGTRTMVSGDILPALLKEMSRLPDHEFVVTPDEQDLGESTFTLLREVPQALRRLGLTEQAWPQIIDYTGGTKTMSAALMLASAQHPCSVSYIGTPDAGGRSKGGLGVVIDGRERVLLQENPWNRIAWHEARTAADLFNRGQYGNAAGVMKRITAQVTETQPQRVFQVLGDIFEGFHCWDVFDHQGAFKFFRSNTEKIWDLSRAAHGPLPDLKPFADSVKELHEILKRIKPREVSWDLIHDLLANALRRAELEKKYEDATARCYAAIERIAQHQLRIKYGIACDDVREEQLPAMLRQDYVRRYTVIKRRPDGTKIRKIQFGQAAAFELLAAMDDPMGRRYADPQRNTKLRAHLDRRNCSILAHGLQPMNEDAFRSLFEDALYLLDEQESALWRFPTIQL